MYGFPDDKCRYLPILKEKLEEFEHVREFASISGYELKLELLGVSRDDYGRARKYVME